MTIRTLCMTMLLGATLPACSQKESPAEKEQPPPAEAPEPAAKTTEAPEENAPPEVPTAADFEAEASANITDENLEQEVETLEAELETE